MAAPIGVAVLAGVGGVALGVLAGWIIAWLQIRPSDASNRCETGDSVTPTNRGACKSRISPCVPLGRGPEMQKRACLCLRAATLRSHPLSSNITTLHHLAGTIRSRWPRCVLREQGEAPGHVQLPLVGVCRGGAPRGLQASCLLTAETDHTPPPCCPALRCCPDPLFVYPLSRSCRTGFLRLVCCPASWVSGSLTPHFRRRCE